MLELIQYAIKLAKQALAEVRNISSNISSGGGGGTTQVYSGHYAGAAPSETPTGAAIAYDLDSPYDVWYWNGSAWQ